MEERLHLPPTGGVNQNHPALSPIETPIHIPAVAVTLIRERAILIQEDIPDKTQQVTQGSVVTPISILGGPILEVIQTKTLQEDTQLQGAILTSSIQLLEATQLEVAIPINTQAELEAIPTRTQPQEAILTSIQLLEVDIPTNIQAELEDIPTRTLLQEAILISTQLQVAILIKGPLTSTQQQVVTQSEVEIQGRVGVSLVGILGVTPAVTLAEGMAVTLTGTQIIRSSVLAMAEGALDTVVMVWQGLLSLVLCRVWVTSPSQQVLPKKP